MSSMITDDDIFQLSFEDLLFNDPMNPKCHCDMRHVIVESDQSMNVESDKSMNVESDKSMNVESDKSANIEFDENSVNWDQGNDNFVNYLLKNEADFASFDFLCNNHDFISCDDTTPRFCDKAQNSSGSDSGFLSVDHMPLISNSESSSFDEIVTKMKFSYNDISVKEKIDENKDNCVKKNTSTINIQQPLLETTTRTVFTPPKQSKGPIAISKNLPTPFFKPINSSNVKTIENGKTINAEALSRLQSIQNGRRVYKNNERSMVSKCKRILKQNKVVMSDCSSDEFDSLNSPLILTDEEKRVMEKDGIQLPSHYPLKKHEQEYLKRIRKKISNKVSAQHTRKRRKMYFNELKNRVEHYTKENAQLMITVRSLQAEIERLNTTFKLLQNAIASSSTTAQPEKCLLFIMMSLALKRVPKLRPTVTDEKELMPIESQESNTAVPGRSTNLLFSKSGSSLNSTNSKDMLNMVANGSSTDEQSETITAEFVELSASNGLVPSTNHNYSVTSMEDNDIPKLDDNWTKTAKRSVPPEWIDKLSTPIVKSRQDAEESIIVSSDEESF